MILSLSLIRFIKQIIVINNYWLIYLAGYIQYSSVAQNHMNLANQNFLWKDLLHIGFQTYIFCGSSVGKMQCFNFNEEVFLHIVWILKINFKILQLFLISNKLTSSATVTNRISCMSISVHVIFVLLD